ncbi:hypothetical protein EDD15DRAFT_2197290 [Pisolithus albus]|nr:hypothetical protein EDD15DRAFT_2197290 [Pisolithus albus]
MLWGGVVVGDGADRPWLEQEKQEDDEGNVEEKVTYEIDAFTHSKKKGESGSRICCSGKVLLDPVENRVQMYCVAADTIGNMVQEGVQDVVAQQFMEAADKLPIVLWGSGDYCRYPTVCRGKIHVITHFPLENGEADGILQDYQQQASCSELDLQQYLLKLIECEEPCYPNIYPLIERVKLVVKLDTLFNKVLTTATLKTKDFHSNDERGIGPVIAFLSLGSSAKMRY